jgi:hypothetical protein
MDNVNNTTNPFHFSPNDINPTEQRLNLTGQEIQKTSKTRKRKHLEVEYEKNNRKHIGIFFSICSFD